MTDEELERNIRKRKHLLNHGTVVGEYQKQRVGEDGYIVTENWASVEIDGNIEQVKEPEENSEYRKFHKMERKLWNFPEK